MRRGFGTKELLLAVMVLCLFASIILPLYLSDKNRALEASEASRMRQVFMGLALYESDNSGQVAPSLEAALFQIGDERKLISKRDPFANSKGPFPADPGLSGCKRDSNLRVSDSYLWQFVANKRIEAPKDRITPLEGLLVNEWMGSVEPLENFRASVSGQVFRVNLDGSLVKPNLGERTLGDAKAIFLSKP